MMPALTLAALLVAAPAPAVASDGYDQAFVDAFAEACVPTTRLV